MRDQHAARKFIGTAGKTRAAEGVSPNPISGEAKLAWLKTLKNSARNSNLPLSPSILKAVSLAMEKSTFVRPGPRTMFRPACPRNPSPGIVNAHGSNHKFGVPTGVPAGTRSQPRDTPFVILPALIPGTRSGRVQSLLISQNPRARSVGCERGSEWKTAVRAKNTADPPSVEQSCGRTARRDHLRQTVDGVQRKVVREIE